MAPAVSPRRTASAISPSSSPPPGGQHAAAEQLPGGGVGHQLHPARRLAGDDGARQIAHRHDFGADRVARGARLRFRQPDPAQLGVGEDRRGHDRGCRPARGGSPPSALWTATRAW